MIQCGFSWLRVKLSFSCNMPNLAVPSSCRIWPILIYLIRVYPACAVYIHDFGFSGKSTIYHETQHPQGTAGLEKVQEVDQAISSKYQRQASAPEAQFPKPVFTVPLQPEVLLTEAQPLHLEAQVEPRNDPDLKIEWFFNGKAIVHGTDAT